MKINYMYISIATTSWNSKSNINILISYIMQIN